VKKALKEHPRECLGRELLSTVDKWQCYTMFAFSHYAAEDTLEKKMEHKSFKALIQAPPLPSTAHTAHAHRTTRHAWCINARHDTTRHDTTHRVICCRC
jgi:hypothetical protein